MIENNWIMPSGKEKGVVCYKCPYCGKEVAGKKHHIIQSEFYFPNVGISNTDIYYVLECPNCHRPTIYDVSDDATFPSGRSLKSVQHIPENIEKIYNEVCSCISAKCYTAAVILARTAIMHICVEQNACKNKTFAFYVDYLCDNHYIPQNAKGWVDKIRKMANDSVHNLEFWEKEDAYLIGKFLMYLLIFVYELPSQV